MALYINNHRDDLVPDGEYTAKIVGVKQTRDGENLVFRCALTTEGFNNTIVAGFCGAHWRPSNRTTANLRQWCINLGMNVVSGHEADLNLEELVGKECRVIVQSYKSRAGEDKCKVSNILPFDKRTPVKLAIQNPGLHIGTPAAQPAAAAPVEPAAQTPAEQPQQTAPAASASEDDLW